MQKPLHNFRQYVFAEILSRAKLLEILCQSVFCYLMMLSITVISPALTQLGIIMLPSPCFTYRTVISQVHAMDVELKKKKPLGLIWINNMLPIPFMWFHFMFNLAVLSQRPSMLFFFLGCRSQKTSFTLSELSQKLWCPLITSVPSRKHVPVCFPELDWTLRWRLCLWCHFRLTTTETLITAVTLWSRMEPWCRHAAFWCLQVIRSGRLSSEE